MIRLDGIISLGFQALLMFAEQPLKNKSRPPNPGPQRHLSTAEIILDLQCHDDPDGKGCKGNGSEEIGCEGCFGINLLHIHAKNALDW